jgi:glycosyltransferase involved in cell wall biosynthesis
VTDAIPPRHVCVLFHESEPLGAGVSIVRALGELRRSGWTASGWFPGDGPLVDASESVLDQRGLAPRPIAFSVRGWRSDPGLVARLRRTPMYLNAFDRWLTARAPTIVHANSLLVLPEATIARRRGYPVLVQLHELPPPGLKRNLTLRWAAAVADVLVGVSRPVSTMLQECAGRTPVLTIHNGVPDTPPTHPPRDRVVVGTIGHVARTKGTDVFLEAARLALLRRPQLRFEHIGPSRIWNDAAFDDRVEALAAAPPLREAVRMLGAQPSSDAIANWNVFVLPSRQEAFPLSTLEAMAAGLPVIATAVGGISEQLQHLETGILVPPEDPGAVAEWIVRLHDDPTLRADLGHAAREHVFRAFPLRAQAEALGRAYTEAIERQRLRGAAPRLHLAGDQTYAEPRE